MSLMPCRSAKLQHCRAERLHARQNSDHDLTSRLRYGCVRRPRLCELDALGDMELPPKACFAPCPAIELQERSFPVTLELQFDKFHSIARLETHAVVRKRWDQGRHPVPTSLVSKDERSTAAQIATLDPQRESAQNGPGQQARPTCLGFTSICPFWITIDTHVIDMIDFQLTCT